MAEEKKKKDEKKGTSHPIRDDDYKPLETKAADMYVKYMNKDEQAILAIEHDTAATKAYTNTIDFIKDEKKLSLTETVKDKKLINDILEYFLVDIIKKIGSKKANKDLDDFLDAVKRGHFNSEGKVDEDERFGRLANHAKAYLDVEPEEFQKLRQSMESNKYWIKDFITTLRDHVVEGKTLHHYNTKYYFKVFGEAHSKDIGKYIQGTQNFKALYKAGKDNRLDLITAQEARYLVDSLAMGKPIQEEQFLNRYGIESKLYTKKEEKKEKKKP